MTTALIFDYGGTLDSRGEHWSHVIRRGYTAAGISLTDEQFRDAYVHAERALAKNRYIEPHHNFHDLMLIKVGIEMARLIELGAMTAAQAAVAQPIEARYCYDAARECTTESAATLRRLRDAGIPMVLVSNFYGNIGAVLEDFGLAEFFPTIIESAVVGVRKPDPAIFALGVEALGRPADEVAVIGDSYSKDIAPALSLGCRAFWLRGQGWDDSEATKTYTDSIQKVAEVAEALL